MSIHGKAPVTPPQEEPGIAEQRQRERDEDDRLYAEWRAERGLETLPEHLPEARNSST